MSSVKACVAWLSLALGVRVPCQQPLLVREIAGANATAVGVLWQHDGDRAIARVLAECRRTRAGDRAPALVSSAVHVDGELAGVVGVARAGDEATVLAFVTALLDDASPGVADRCTLAIARGALCVDDEQFLYPGSVLACRARAAFGVAGAHDTASSVLAALTVPQVGDRLGRGGALAIGVAGQVSPGLLAALRGLRLPPTAAEPHRAGAAAVPPGGQAEIHTRVDQPFVMAAFPVPEDVSRPALAVALEVARARAAKGLRGSEALARTPAVAWSLLAGDDVVCFHRRGRNPVGLLPGETGADAAAERAATAAELEAFLQQLRDDPPRAPELAAARAHLIAEAGLAEGLAGAGDAAVVGGRLLAALLASHRRIEASAVSAVTAEAAHAALVATLVRERGYWHSLLPEPRKDRGWRRR